MPVPSCGNGRVREGASSEAEPARRGCEPSSEAEPLEGAVNPRARRNLLEGGVYPRARRSLLEGTFEWAALVGRGDHRSAGRAPLVCLSEMCLTLVFLQVLSGVSPVVLGDPQGCPRQ
jgi:hypothetical protein